MKYKNENKQGIIKDQKEHYILFAKGNNDKMVLWFIYIIFP